MHVVQDRKRTAESSSDLPLYVDLKAKCSDLLHPALLTDGNHYVKCLALVLYIGSVSYQDWSDLSIPLPAFVLML